VVLVPGALLFLIPLPGLNATQSHLLGIFVATIIALVAQPVPMGVSVLIAMTLLALTGTLAPAKVLSGFSNVTVWLIFTAFLFARSVSVTGFGNRVGYLFIKRFARSPLTLGYSITGANVVLAPFIPSDTARGGGIIFPITRSVASDFGSEPGPTAGRIGTYLMLIGFHSTYTTSAMFSDGNGRQSVDRRIRPQDRTCRAHLDAMVSGSVVPGLLSLLIVPGLLIRFFKPEIEDMAPARELARSELERMGPPKRGEKWLMAIMLGVMAGWVTSPLHGIPNTFVALAGLSALLLVKVMTWDDLLAEHKAWDALIWFAPLIMMPIR